VDFTDHVSIGFNVSRVNLFLMALQNKIVCIYYLPRACYYLCNPPVASLSPLSGPNVLLSCLLLNLCSFRRIRAHVFCAIQNYTYSCKFMCFNPYVFMYTGRQLISCCVQCAVQNREWKGVWKEAVMTCFNIVCV
jgi:hypothetical protein